MHQQQQKITATKQQSIAPDAHRNFDYLEFAKQNNIYIEGASSPLVDIKQGDKPKHAKEFESEFFKLFNKR